jgi:hypothetical protein
MRPDPAVGVDATEPGTRVLAGTVDAGELGVTVVIDGALRSAVRWVADHAGHAVALALTANISGPQAVGARWVWLTGVGLDGLKWWWWSLACHKRIPDVALVANTDGEMVGHLAVGVTATRAGAWVNAMKVPALLVGGTVHVDDTLWPTVGGQTNHFRQTGTLASVPNHTGRVTVGAAGLGSQGSSATTS